jgi:hypothetical protein
LHIGQISGGLSLAHKYPQTLHLQTGKGRELILTFEGWDGVLIFARTSFAGRLSGIELIGCFPSATAEET